MCLECSTCAMFFNSSFTVSIMARFRSLNSNLKRNLTILIQHLSDFITTFVVSFKIKICKDYDTYNNSINRRPHHP